MRKDERERESKMRVTDGVRKMRERERACLREV